MSFTEKQKSTFEPQIQKIQFWILFQLSQKMLGNLVSSWGFLKSYTWTHLYMLKAANHANIPSILKFNCFNQKAENDSVYVPLILVIM